MRERNQKSQPLLASIRRRLGSRGVAMVEGAIVFPIMAGFLVLMEMSHHSYDAYITAEHVAEERVWSGATVGSKLGDCGDERDDTTYAPPYFKMRAKGSGDTTLNAPGQGGDDQGGDNTDPTQAGGNSGKAVGSINMQGPGGFFIHHDSAIADITADRGTFTFHHPAASRSKVFCNQENIGSIWDLIGL